MIIALSASIIGLAVGLYSLSILLLDLRIELDTTSLRVRQRILGIPAGHPRFDRHSLRALRIQQSYSASTGHDHKVFYALQVVLRAGKRVTIVRNLEGRAVAEQGQKAISLFTGIP